MTAFKWLRWDVSLFLLCVLIFVVWPQLDYWWAGQFYRAGEAFYLRNLPPVQWVYRGFSISMGRMPSMVAAMADPAGFTWCAYLGAAAPSTWTHCPATRLFSVGAAVVRAGAIG